MNEPMKYALRAFCFTAIRCYASEGSALCNGAAVGRSVGDNPVRVGFEQQGSRAVKEGVACGSANCA